MTPAQRRKFWATITAIWGEDIGEYITYGVMIARYGKASTKSLTQTEIDELLNWLDELESASADHASRSTETRR